MSDKALVPQGDIALDAYGGRPEIRELSDRLTIMLPGAKDLGRAGTMALAQASLAMGLNPLIGELWAIPQGRRKQDGTYDSYAIMVGIKGLRSKAHDQVQADGGMFVPHIRRAREEEIEGLQINKGDIVRACDLTVSGERARRHHDLTGEIPRYTGVGIYRNGEKTRMSPLHVARKRAEAEAIKQAFDVPLSFVYGAAPGRDLELESGGERYTEIGDSLANGSATEAIEEVFGEYIETTGDPFLNGEDDPGPEEVGHEGWHEVQGVDMHDLDLDFVPDGIEDWGSAQWSRLRTLAVQYLGYDHPNHVTNTLAKLFSEEDKARLTYTAAWQALADHQKAKQTEPA